MRAIKYRELKHLCESMGAAKAEQHLSDAIRDGHLQPEDFSIREWAQATLGWEFIDACKPQGENSRVTEIFEAADAVDVTAFRNITGQIVYSKIMQGFEAASKVGTNLVTTIPTKLDGEKIPGVTYDNDGIDSLEVAPGMPYPSVGFGEEYLNTPTTRKYGKIVPVTKEAIFFDRTALVLQTASQVGEHLGIKKEKLLIDMISGYGGGSTPSFDYGGKWKWKGTEYDVYESNAVDFSSYFYTNHITDTLTNYTDLDAALQQFGEQRDPNTREPITVSPTLTLLVPPALFPTARNIANATEVRASTDSAAYTHIFSNPFGNSINVVESRYLWRRLQDNASVSAANARAYWYLGDFKRAFAWMENWGITPSQAPTNAEAEFRQDIIAQYKASMRGAPAVLAPQYVLRSTGAG